MMKDFVFQMPDKVEVGFSKSKRIGEIAEEMSFKKILLVVDYNLSKIGVVEYIYDTLRKRKIDFKVFNNIKNEPTISEVDQAIGELDVATNFDGVIGIGGGSTIDVAKLLAVSGSIKGSIKNYIGINLIEEDGLPTIMVPTTSGTGAEVTPNAIVQDPVKGWKKGVVSSRLVPDRVIIDPELTISLPPKITAETGIDAFTHAIECFICNKSNATSDLFALDSMRLINKYLRRAVRNGSDKEARYYMALGSLYGGIAITNSGTGGVHALAYPLGGKYNLSHGLSNSILLTEVMRFNAETVPEKFVQVAGTMGIRKDALSKERIVELAINKIHELVNDVGISFREFKVSEEVLEDLAGLAMAEQRLLQNNPRPIGYKIAKNIYRKTLLSEN